MAKKTTSAKNPDAAAPGRGKKQCPGCNEVVGARSATCPTCGYDFKKSATKKSATKKRVTKKKTGAKKAATVKAGGVKSKRGTLDSQLRQKKADLEKQIEAIDTLLG
jgi:hypothetical protein